MADSSSLSHVWNYDVFLSFGLEDTRTRFVDNLYTALVQSRIRAFKDDAKEEFTPSELWKAIQQSRLAIVVFSKSYASSSRCLDELVTIMESSKKYGHLVLPIYYYGFDPSNLRRQGSVFGELFSKYEMKKVRAWTSALVEASNLCGLGLTDYGYQEKRIREIVELVLSKLNFENVNLSQNTRGTRLDNLGDATSSHEKLIGIERRVQLVKDLLQVERVKVSSNSALSSLSPRSSRRTYDVYMCFKGNDTCKDFADQLYCALEKQGICAFCNDQGHAIDESISSKLLKAIEESSIAVVIFSKNFAAASCYLDELVKIIKCNEEFGQIVFPVFYDVDPSDVRNPNGVFGQAIMLNNLEKIELWRNSLAKAGSFAGWYLNCTPKSHEAKVIRNLVDMISRRLVRLPSSVDCSLVGIKVRLKHVKSLLHLDSGGVRMLGIWGMGGIGKTTIARAVYDQVRTCFDTSCFTENISEVSKNHGLRCVQKEVLSRLLKDNNLHVRSVHEGTNLISDRLARCKVLIVLDDVDRLSQLEALAGACSWFGGGSRIIITTRDESLLVEHNVMQIYYVKELDDNESSLFLRKHAFKTNDHDVTKGCEDLLPQVVNYASGLPLALKVLSLLLCGKSKKDWTSTLSRLEVFPEKKIQDTLKKSFDSLDDDLKDIFLDIACLFNGMKTDKLVKILDGCGFSGKNGIRLLEQKSLVTILDGCIKVHRLLEQMGRHIVRQMHPDEPGKHSRLWHVEEVAEVLMDKMGTKEISAIVVDKLRYQDATDMTGAFMKMPKLKILQLYNCCTLRSLQNLPNDLRWLTWENYPLPSLPRKFEANKLVGLELIHSSISEPWPVYKHLVKLRFLDLSYSRMLIKTPDFTGTPNLIEVKLEYCTNLIMVHESIGCLKNLASLSLRRCSKLETLPDLGYLESLESLVLSENLMLPRLQGPPTVGFLANLVKLDFSDCRIMSLPYSIRNLKLQSSFPIHDKLVQIVLELHACENSDVQHSNLGSSTLSSFLHPHKRVFETVI